LGQPSLTARSTAAILSGGACTVAISLVGAPASALGDSTKVKFMPRLAQSMRRSEAMRAVISRPSTSTVMLSPTPTANPRAMLASSESNGGPS
jgi:hypothetical protein